MSMFKVGDLIRGDESARVPYGITNETAVCRVVEVAEEETEFDSGEAPNGYRYGGEGDIVVEVVGPAEDLGYARIDHWNHYFHEDEVGNQFAVYSEFFELVKPFKGDPTDEVELMPEVLFEEVF